MMKKMLITLFILMLCNVVFAPMEKGFYIAESKPIFYIPPPTRVEIQFKLLTKHLGFKESSNRWKIINLIGCMGEWQFSPNTLKKLGYGYITPETFKDNPDIFPETLQYKILCDYFKYNEKVLKDYMHYIGQTINDVKITKSGLLAAAHLGGAGSVMKWLDSQGQTNKVDLNKMSIQHYLIEFSGYKI